MRETNRNRISISAYRLQLNRGVPFAKAQAVLGEQYALALAAGKLRIVLEEGRFHLRYFDLNLALKQLNQFQSILFHLKHLPAYTESTVDMVGSRAYRGPRLEGSPTGAGTGFPIGPKTWQDVYKSWPENWRRERYRNTFTGEAASLSSTAEVPGLPHADIFKVMPVALLINEPEVSR
jgi:maltooligosyltrehalose synthase